MLDIHRKILINEDFLYLKSFCLILFIISFLLITKIDYHCKSKKELLLKYDKYYDEFVQAINDLISDGEVTPDEP